jgi:hypothetical protein
MTAAVDGTRLTERIRLSPDRPAQVEVTLDNQTPNGLLVKSVRLTGSVLGLTFFDVGTTTELQVPAGQIRTWRVEVDITDLEGQATGLMSVKVDVVSEKRRTLGTVTGTADVRGSIMSTYGLFGLGLLVVTALLWASALVALARRRLPANRWKRAVRFAPGGFGVGLVAVVSLSTLRITSPSGTAEIGFVLGAGAVAFLLGYITPPPDDPVVVWPGPSQDPNSNPYWDAGRGRGSDPGPNWDQAPGGGRP